MRKLYEFVENHDISEDILKYLDTFIFYDGDTWMFADGDKDFISNYIGELVPLDYFIRLGNEISVNLNIMNITPQQYDSKDINRYLR